MAKSKGRFVIVPRGKSTANASLTLQEQEGRVKADISADLTESYKEDDGKGNLTLASTRGNEYVFDTVSGKTYGISMNIWEVRPSDN